ERMRHAARQGDLRQGGGRRRDDGRARAVLVGRHGPERREAGAGEGMSRSNDASPELMSRSSLPEGTLAGYPREQELKLWSPRFANRERTRRPFAADRLGAGLRRPLDAGGDEQQRQRSAPARGRGEHEL